MSTAHKFTVVVALFALLMGSAWTMGWRAGHQTAPKPVIMTPEAYLDSITHEVKANPPKHPAHIQIDARPVSDTPATAPKPKKDVSANPFAPLNPQ